MTAQNRFHGKDKWNVLEVQIGDEMHSFANVWETRPIANINRDSTIAMRCKSLGQQNSVAMLAQVVKTLLKFNMLRWFNVSAGVQDERCEAPPLRIL